MNAHGQDRGPVLVLDADQASALAIVRSLGRHGLSVDTASTEPRPIAARSRYAGHHRIYPDPLTDEASFFAWVAATLASKRHTLIIPVTERTLVPLMRRQAEIESGRIAMASPEALEQVLDKARTLALAESLDIPVPRSIAVKSLDDLGGVDATLTYPMVIKPARSVGQDKHQRIQLSVTYAHDRTQLESQTRHALRFGDVLLQEYFPGDGVGVELIADHGKVCFAFQHRRLHEVPLTGGGSSLRISEPVAPALRAAAEALIRTLNWHGVAMVEFKYAPTTGDFRLMEINGRFWGSLPLAVAAGADFPALLYELYTTGQIQPPPPARDGIVCRNLGRDLDWLEHVLRKAAPSALVRLPPLSEVVRDSLLVFSPRHRFDVQSLRDPWPGLIDLGRMVSRQGRRIHAMIQGRRRMQAERRVAKQAGRNQMQRAQRVLFLCYGNINRSALAHVYAAQRCDKTLTVDSAGFHGNSDRPADPVMVDIAAGHAVDLENWRSRTLTDAAVRDADIILAMEPAHLDQLFQIFPDARGKAFLLGALTATSPHETPVEDPYGHAPAVYERICRQVLQCVDAWLATRTP